MCQLQGKPFLFVGVMVTQSCTQSADDNMDLISTEQFYAEAPESVSNPETTRSVTEA